MYYSNEVSSIKRIQEPIKLSHSMSQLLVRQKESNKDLDRLICEAFDCEEPATETVGVSAGNYGVIELNVCIDCVSKFVELPK